MQVPLQVTVIETMSQWISNYWNRLWDVVGNEQMWEATTMTILKIAIIWIASRLLIRILYRSIDHALAEKKRRRLHMDARRKRTVGRLLRNIISYTVNFITILMVLSELNIHLGPVLAGAGVLGLAIGFGAQSLVKDVISGFFIIFEDQFGVGDVIQTGAFKGTVELVGMRSTRIRSWTGEVHIIPNGSITQVTNFSVHHSLAVVDLTIPKDVDLRESLDRIGSVLRKIRDQSEFIVSEPQVLGIQKLSPSDVVIRITAECKANTEEEVSRHINLELKKMMDELG